MAAPPRPGNPLGRRRAAPGTRARPVRAAADARRALGRGRRAPAATALALVVLRRPHRHAHPRRHAHHRAARRGGHPRDDDPSYRRRGDRHHLRQHRAARGAAARRTARARQPRGVDRAAAHRARRRRPGGRARPAGHPGQPLRRRAHPRLEEVQVGDFIRLETGEEGQIVDINWRNTTVQQVQNNHAIIPNAKLAQSIIINYFRPQPEMSVLVPVGVSYGSDLDHVERVTREVGAEVMREVEGGVPPTSRSSASPGSGTPASTSTSSCGRASSSSST